METSRQKLLPDFKQIKIEKMNFKSYEFKSDININYTVSI